MLVKILTSIREYDKGDGANQIGGSFVYRFDNGSWQSATLSYHSDVESGTVNHNQFWNCIISMPASAGDLDYYFIVEFDNRDTTYLFGNDSNSSVEADAQINPYIFIRNLPAT
jgi:hypothetical protein